MVKYDVPTGLIQQDIEGHKRLEITQKLQELMGIMQKYPFSNIALPGEATILPVGCSNYDAGVSSFALYTTPSGLTLFHLPLDGKTAEIERGLAEENIKTSIKDLVQEMQGNEVELDTSKIGRSTVVRDSNYWDKYWQGEVPDILETYQTEIYPSVVAQVVKLARQNKKDNITCLDIFAGEGGMTESLIGELVGMDKKVTIHIQDNNPGAVTKAQERFTGYNQVIVHRQMDIIAKPRLMPQGFPFPDIVTAVGGLNEGVMTRDQALKVAKKVHDQMQKGGYFLVTGYTNCLLNAEDFRRLGFKVLNMSIPQNLFTEVLPKQFYILQKS